MMKDCGLVSIIMPSYNTGAYIMDSIQSVLSQTYNNWELIIVDDNSTDNTRSILELYRCDDRIRVLYNDKNLGAAISRNRAIRSAKGRWIAFLDSDDLWLPDKLQKQLYFMIDNDYHFSYSNYRLIDNEGEELGVLVTGPSVITKELFFDYCWPGCLTVMYDQSFIGPIEIRDIKKNNDYAMWLEICKYSNCYLLNDDLALYRTNRKDSISNHSYLSLVYWHYMLFRLCENMNCFQSVYHTMRNVVFGVIKKIFYTRKISS